MARATTLSTVAGIFRLSSEGPFDDQCLLIKAMLTRGKGRISHPQQESLHHLNRHSSSKGLFENTRKLLPVKIIKANSENLIAGVGQDKLIRILQVSLKKVFNTEL